MKSLLTASTLSIALTLCASAVNAKSFLLQPSDKSFETQVCYFAATHGLDAAKTFLRENGRSFIKFQETQLCNNMSIKTFVDEYGVAKEYANDNSSAITLVTENTSVEAKLCLDAVSMGEQAARKKHNISSPVLCNGRDLGEFLYLLENEKVEANTVAQNAAD